MNWQRFFLCACVIDANVFWFYKMENKTIFNISSILISRKKSHLSVHITLNPFLPKRLFYSRLVFCLKNCRKKFSNGNFKILTSESERTTNFTSEKYYWLLFFFDNFLGKTAIDYKMAAWEEMG